jgi:hypothetical protein
MDKGRKLTGVLRLLAYRTALESPSAVRSRTQIRSVYHTLNPHRALSPVPDEGDATTVAKQQQNETMYRQLLAQALLAVLLPTEDLENVCLRSLVGDILADLLLGEIVSGNVCEGWFLWKTVTKFITEIRAGDVGQETKDRLEMEGLASASMSEKHLEDTDLPGKNQSGSSAWVWRFFQYAYQSYTLIRYVIIGLLQVASTSALLSSTSTAAREKPSPSIPTNPAEEPSTSGNEGNVAKLPVIKYRVFGMTSQLLDIPKRMPWLGGSLALLQYQLLSGPGGLGESGSILDR